MKDWTTRLMDKLAGELSEKEAAQFEADTKQDDQLNEDYAFFTDAWNQMAEFEVPAAKESLSHNFYSRLNQKIEKEENALPTKLKAILHSVFQNTHTLRNLSFGLFLLAFGFILGGKWNKKTIHVNQTTVQTTVPASTSNQHVSYVPISQKIHNIKTLPSSAPDANEAIEKLKQVLQTERSTNVKLAAIRQISQHYSLDKSLKSFISKQIEKEPSPMVQVELLNLLIDHNQPKETIYTMESMLNKRQLNPAVQEKIRNDLPVLRASFVK